MKSKNVLMVIYNCPPLKSGAAKQALLLADILKNKANISILSIDSERVDNRDYKSIHIGKNIFHKIWSIIRISIYISFSRFDTIHHISLTKYTFLSVLLSKIFGKKVIAKMTMFGYDDPLSLNEISPASWFMKYIYVSLDYWVAITPGMVSEIYKNIVFIPNAVQLPNKLNFVKKNVVFLCSGVICSRKNQIKVLDFWEKIIKSDKFNDGELVFIGSYQNDFSEYDKTYINDFLNYASFFDNVTVIGHTNNVEKFLKKSTYYISFSSLEGLSNSLLESLSYGLSPIVYDKHKNTLIRSLYQYGYYFDMLDSADPLLITDINGDLLRSELRKGYSVKGILKAYSEIYAN
jgi:glycosyltransferase involved in cell wall biosynthesis